MHDEIHSLYHRIDELEQENIFLSPNNFINDKNFLRATIEKCK